LNSIVAYCCGTESSVENKELSRLQTKGITATLLFHVDEDCCGYRTVEDLIPWISKERKCVQRSRTRSIRLYEG
jgi:hypothetical protein